MLYTNRIDEVGAALSIGTVGENYDCENAMAESVKGRLKTEPHYPGGTYRQRWALKIAICARVSWFNEEWLHSELNDRTPEEFGGEYRHNSQPDAA